MVPALSNMFKLAFGATRIVILLKDRVIKLPNPLNGWIPFFEGFLSNYREGCTWFGEDLSIEEKGKLCPVLSFSSSGFWLIMQRVDRVLEDEVDSLYDPENFKDITLDDKPDNFGVLNGKVVVIDYG